MGLTEDEKFAFARKQNILRRHLTREQKQTLIAEQIARTPNRSDRSIAGDLACDHKTVGAVWKAAPRGLGISPRRRYPREIHFTASRCRRYA